MKSFWKDLFRTIKASLGRFLAIAAICALGVGFYGGLQMTCGSMKQEITNFYNETNMMDIRIVCSYGISEQNIEDYKKIDGVKGVMPAYETDILTTLGNDQTTIRLHSLPNNLDASDDNYINQLNLEQGRLPETPEECVLSADAVLVNPPVIGDEIQIMECSTGLEDTLSIRTLQVVGFVHSSYYVQNVQMGTSTLGKGTVNDFAYVLGSAFYKDFPFSEVFLTVDGASECTTATDEYQVKIDEVMGRIIEIAPSEAEIRTASVKSDFQSQLDKAKQEFTKQKQDAENELSLNEDKLNNAWAQIEQAQDPILEAENFLNAQYAEFNASKASVMDPINESIAVAEYLQDKFDNLESRHKSNIANIENHKNQVNDKNSVLAGLSGTISDLEESIHINNEIIALIKELLEEQTYVEILQRNINYSNELITISQTFYNEIQKTPTEEVYKENLTKYNNKFNELYIGFYARLAICDEAIVEIRDYLIKDMYPLREKCKASFDELEAPLIEAKAQLEFAKRELNLGKTDFYAGLSKFLTAKNQAFNMLNDAEAKLNSSQNELNKLEDAKFFIMDRTKNIGAINFKNDSERIASIANVFPLIFFFVALLVALTSMTRMIEEERIAIGTYKALGFSKIYISSKYIFYGIVASFIGSVIGLAVLTQFLPFVIMFAYSIIYILPINLPMPFDFTIGIFSTIAGVGLTVVATLMAAAKSLSLVPARLMIPNAPKAGKRIFLEFVKPIWSALNFNWKITCRNMFLYKKRLFMTLIGIAGCTALLLTGFGLHDSISDIMDKQFDEIAVDNFKLVFKSSATEEQKNEVNVAIDKSAQGTNWTFVREENMICMPAGHPNAMASVIVPKNSDQFEQMRLLQDRNTGEKFTLSDDGVYISEKLANMMQLKKGDVLIIYNQDLIGNPGDNEYKLKIAGVVENYIAHYVYMTPSVYKQYFNKDCVYNNIIARPDVDAESKQNLIDSAKEFPAVEAAYFTTDTRSNFEKMLQSVNMVVVVLIVSAGLLAFVVLYNLININICERAREIATLKVLGSNKREINMYIHRETFMLSVLGSILGILLGIVMEQFVITSAEVDYVMFGRNIYWWSYVISIGITMIFTVLVALFMRKKLFSISMVESLKSVE